jgi:hypothetical protein
VNDIEVPVTPLSPHEAIEQIKGRALLRAYGLPWPWGEGCKRLLDLSITRDTHRMRCLPPSPPLTYLTDDEGNWIRDRTEAEKIEAQARYERAEAEYKRTGGLVITHGPRHVQATFLTDKAIVKLIFGGGEWHLIQSYSLPPGRNDDERERFWRESVREFAERAARAWR